MTAFDQCACSGINLDKFIQPLILACLAKQELHGYGLIQKIDESPMFMRSKPDPTGIYRYLKSMEDRNLVVSSWDLPESGPPKRKYRITPNGIECLRTWASTLKTYQNSLQSLISDTEKTLSELDIR